MLKKFSVNAVPGTMNQKELRTFFGGKVIYSEDTININDDSIAYSQVVSDYNNGYQYFDYNTIPSNWETQFYENLTDLKYNNQSMSMSLTFYVFGNSESNTYINEEICSLKKFNPKPTIKECCGYFSQITNCWVSTNNGLSPPFSKLKST